MVNSIEISNFDIKYFNMNCRVDGSLNFIAINLFAFNRVYV